MPGAAEPFRYLSVCSGIEAASVAFHPLGWEALAFAEIEAFPRAVLAHRFPDVRLWGDFTTLRDEPWIADADLVVGGTPCQAFSVAGLRRSMGDNRGNLALEFIRLADAVDDLRHADGRAPAWVLWENVPGVFSVEDNAFGAFLAGLVGGAEPIVPRGGWTDAGVVSGPRRVAAWRVLDARHFGLAQRRRRVFVLARGHPRGWSAADALLPLIDGLRGHPAPRRQAGAGVARAVGASTGGPSAKEQQYTFVGADGPLNALEEDLAGTICADAKPGSYSGQDAYTGRVVAEAFGGNNTAGEIDLAPSLLSQPGAGWKGDFESETFVAEPWPPDLADPLTAAEGKTYTHEGSGNFRLHNVVEAPVAFSAKDHGQDMGDDISPTLRGGVHDASHANGGTPPAVLFSLMPQNSGRDFKAREVDVAQPVLASGPNPKDQGGDVVLTLASRGRGDTHQLEVRDDGLANALLTPNGGRGGMGVGAVAYALRTNQTGANGGNVAEDVSHGLSADEQPPAVAFMANSRDEVRLSGGDGDIAGTLAADPGSRGTTTFLAYAPDVAAALVARSSRGGGQTNSPGYSADESLVAFDPTQLTHPENRSNPQPGDPAPTLAPSAHPPAMASPYAVRRLTPRECERLQGFPDDWTLIPFRGAWAADGPRYKAIGNAMAVPVMAHIGASIADQARRERPRRRPAA